MMSIFTFHHSRPLLDLAEYALNKWIMHPELDGKDFVNSSTVTADPQLHYNFDILEEKSRKIHMSVGNHILEWMVSKSSKIEGSILY